MGLILHHEQGSDHGKITDAVDGKAPSLADRRNYQAGDGRADQARTVSHRGIDRDRIAKVVSVFDHLHEKRLPPWHVEGIDQALQGHEGDDLPERDDVRQGQSR